MIYYLEIKIYNGAYDMIYNMEIRRLIYDYLDP